MKTLRPPPDLERRVTPPSIHPCAEDSDPGLLGRIRRTLRCFRQDVAAVLQHDPAARSQLEVVLTYPGVHALWLHRAAHSLWQRNQPLAARVLSHANRFVTGVEIHPGATIGRGVFIDHGMGVVIGETATVGDGCILYKGVVLGGTSSSRTVRHPQIGKEVVIGSNACVLGAIEVGDGSRIGSGSVVIRDVPNGATVVGVPGRIVAAPRDVRSRFDVTLDHASLPDPVNQMLRSLKTENERLHARLTKLEQVMKIERDPEHDHDPHLVDADLSTGDLPSQTGG